MAIRVLVYILFVIAVVDATQIMHRPDDYKMLLKPFPHALPHNLTARAISETPMKERTVVESPLSKRAGGKLSVGYFTNWFDICL